MTGQPGFELFGTAHVAVLGLIAATAILLPLLIRRRWPGAARPVGLLLALLLLLQEAVQVTLVALSQGLTVGLLPLHLCTLAVYLTAWMLVTGGQRVYEVVYFWGLGGTTQALLTPELGHGFPSPYFLLFFLGHGLVVVGVAYATLVYGLRPYAVSILRVALITLAVAAAILVVNLWLGTNFLFLMAKPARASLLDWLGPWPWYWLSLIGIALLTFLILYLPFAVADRRRGAGHQAGPRPR
jgi:hypothetical integral membrane protein (TIGR02206 family)